MIKVSKSKLLIVVFGIFIIFSSGKINASRPDSLFSTDAIIEMELRSNFTLIEKERTAAEPKFLHGELTYNGADGKKVSLKVDVTSRGNFRRDPQNCDFPPILLKFVDKEVKNTLFHNQNRLKLVTPCHFDRDVIQEYLIYRMYSLVTANSLKVRLARISYFDTGKNKKLFERYSFFLEDEDRAAERMGSTRIKKFITPFDLDQDLYRKMAVFQFIIGNKDWFVSSRKNIIIYQPSDSTRPPYAVPYDFDFAGFVDADYTKPEGVPDSRLATRKVFKGLCYTTVELEETFEYYESLLPGFEALIRDTKILPVSSQNEDIGYIREFFTSISDPQFVKKKFLTDCETRAMYNIKD